MTKLTGVNMKAEALKDRGASGAVLTRRRARLCLAGLTPRFLPYLNKPFVIDDPHFLMMARQIVKHPTHPMDFTLCLNFNPYRMKAYQLTAGNS